MHYAGKALKLCFGIQCNFLIGVDAPSYEDQYNAMYKPLVSALYNLPELPCTMYLSGSFIEWMQPHHPEFFMIFEEMISRKQIDILGGGYYSPLFPLLPPADRVGQIELLTTVLRKCFGKRPRGAWLPSSAWDPSLISSFSTCGIEYILLDKTFFETTGFQSIDGFTPVTLEDSGKTIIAFPLDNHYKNLEQFSPELFFHEMNNSIKPESERIIVIFFEQKSIQSLFNFSENSSSWFQTFLNLLRNGNSEMELSTTSRYLKTKSILKQTYICPGVSPYDFYGILPTEEIRNLPKISAKHFLLESRNILNLYAKMMYVHILVNQLRGDKARKKNAREELWRAQNNEAYRLPYNHNDESNRLIRTITYKNLLIAEKTTRLRGVFSPSIITFDFDMDGLKEYLCQLESLNMYVHACGGRIFEFDVFKVYRNYCDISLPSSGLFIDHFINSEDLPLIDNGDLQSIKSVFSETLYQDITVDPLRHEIQLRANGFYGSFQQPISLRKQYSFRNEGIQVQYILKNESPLTLSGIFMIELDLAVIESKKKSSIMTVCEHDTRKEVCIDKFHFDDVSWIQIDDSETRVKFTLDANENPSIYVFPIMNNHSDVVPTTSDGIRIFLYWKVELGPNYEMEKMAFLKIDA